MESTYRTTVRLSGRNTGLEVPPEVLDALGAGKRPSVVVTVGDYSYPSTVGSMGGVAMLPLSKAHREASGVNGGVEVTVTLRLDDAPREVELPEDLAAALTEAGATDRFHALAPSRRKEHVRSVTEAKAADTRARRVTKVLDSLTS